MLGAIAEGYVGEVLVMFGQIVVRVRNCNARGSGEWEELLHEVVLTASRYLWAVLGAEMLCVLRG